VWRRGEVRTEFLFENLRERDHLENSGVDGRITLQWIFRKRYGGTWTLLIWLRIVTVGGDL
jgi:hypothetical protein